MRKATLCVSVALALGAWGDASAENYKLSAQLTRAMDFFDGGGSADRWGVATGPGVNIGKAMDFAGGTLAAGAFYKQDQANTARDFTRIGGSASYRFSQGTNITAIYARNEQGTVHGTEAHSFTVKLGHMWGTCALEVGVCTSAAIAYSEGDDVMSGYTDTQYGVVVNRMFKRQQLDLFGAYMHTRLDTPAGVAGAEDHDVFLLGAKLKFD